MIVIKVYSVSGFSPKDGQFRFFYKEAKNKAEVRKWAKEMGYEYYPETKVEFVCNGGYEELDRLKRTREL